MQRRKHLGGLAVPVLAQDVDGFGHHHGALHPRHRVAEVARGSSTAPSIAFSCDSGLDAASSDNGLDGANRGRECIASLSAVRKLLPHPLLPSCNKDIQRHHPQRARGPRGDHGADRHGRAGSVGKAALGAGRSSSL